MKRARRERGLVSRHTKQSKDGFIAKAPARMPGEQGLREA
jgi:hypothetical protein